MLRVNQSEQISGFSTHPFVCYCKFRIGKHIVFLLETHDQIDCIEAESSCIARGAEERSRMEDLRVYLNENLATRPLPSAAHGRLNFRAQRSCHMRERSRCLRTRSQWYRPGSHGRPSRLHPRRICSCPHTEFSIGYWPPPPGAAFLQIKMQRSTSAVMAVKARCDSASPAVPQRR